MNIINSYYRYIRPENTKSKTRFDLLTKVGNGIDALENSKSAKGEMKIYYTDIPDHYNARAKRKADKIITNAKGNHISSVFVPDLQNNLYAYGDVKNTSHLLLLLFNETYTQLEIFVCENKLNDKTGMFNLFLDAELNNEIDAFRKQAKIKLT